MLAQIEITSINADEINVCTEEKESQFTVLNTGGSSAANVSFQISCPEGIKFTGHSIYNGVGVTIVSNQSNEILSFTAQDLAAGDSIVVGVSYKAQVNAVSEQEVGAVFRNMMEFNSSFGVELHQTDSYNILYPALNIIGVNPSSLTTTSGVNTQREITIVNAGYGRTDQLVLYDVMSDIDLSILSVDVGVLAGDSIVISASDFQSIGNGDTYFDLGETIVVTEVLNGVSCSDKTVTSSFSVAWGCENDEMRTATSYANVLIDFQTPNIALQSSAEAVTCHSDASSHELTLTNQGNGIATNLIVDIFKSKGSGLDDDIISQFIASSVMYQIDGGGYISAASILTTTVGQSSGVYACLGASPINQISLNLPDLYPGQIVDIQWDMSSCCISTCLDESISGWKAELSYSDICYQGSYTKSKTGQGTTSHSMSLFTETPVDVFDQVTADYHFIVSSFENSLPMATDGGYKMVFNLDDGITFDQVVFKSNGVVWTPTSVVQPVAGQVEVTYQLPEPFVVPKSEIVLTAYGDCGSSGWKNVSLQIYAMPDPGCTSCLIPMVCQEEVTTYLHCPLTNCEGMQVVSFESERISLGLPDNNLDGLADVSGSLDMSKVKLNRCMVGDTFQSTVKGVFVTGSSYANLYFETENDYGDVLDYAGAEVTIYDASLAVTHVVSNVPSFEVVNAPSKTFKYDLSIQTLVALEPSLAGYSYQDGDSVILRASYQVVSSVSGGIQESTFLNSFYASNVINPTIASGERYSCGFRHGRITLIGYSFRNDWANNVTINNCNKQIKQYFGMSIGDAPSNYGGGNLFPFEYRQWGNLSNVQVVLPQNYNWVDVTLQQWRTRRTNSTSTQTISVVPDYVSAQGDTLVFNVQQYYDNGSLTYSDDGFHGLINLRVAPTCDVPENTFQNVYWTFEYQKSSAIDGLNSGTIAASPDRVRYRRAVIALSSQNPWQDVNQRSVVWDYKMTNTSSNGSDHAWLHLNSPQNIIIDSVVNDQSGVALTLQGDIYLVGDISAGSTADLSIYGTITNCDNVLISTYAGYECSGYPQDFASFECPMEYMPIYVEPKPAAYQTRISTSSTGNTCSNEVELTIEIASVKIAHVYDMSVKVIVGDTSRINILPSSSQFKYNLSSSYQQVLDPSYSAGEFSYEINDFEASFPANGLPGVLDLNNNRYQLKTTLVLGNQFENGDFITVQIEGENPCAIPLPTTNLAYDPSAKFSENSSAGLNIDAINSWSASWGDFDNDGFDDLFVPGKGVNEANVLYHNNQDGTFTAVTRLPVTSNQGASTSGAWGDYDNDGDLDLFVCNNENGTNRLFENTGGQFTDVTPASLRDEGVYSHSSAWADYNKDGYLDIVVTDFHSTHFNRLFYGDGLGGFTLDADSEVSFSSKSSVGVAWGDYDNDGDLDLFVANTNNEHNDLYENVNGELILTTNNPIVADSAHSVGGVWGDYDNDGDLDLYVTNSKDNEANFFYENLGGSFVKILNSVITQDLTNAHGATWIDFDNDGDLDLTVANDQYGNNLFYTNKGDKTFAKMTNAITQSETQSYGLAWSDFDNDGDYDLYVANQQNTTNEFFVNEKGSCTNYISVKLEGCNSNRNGIGGMVRVKTTIEGQPVWQTKHVSTQTSGMAGQNSMSLLFGIKDASTIDSLVVYWPSGMITELAGVSANQLLTINEACGAKVCGVIFNDVNLNAVQDVDEAFIANQAVVIQPGGFKAYTNADGYFQLYLPDGSYTVTWDASANWSVASPVSGSYPVVINQQQSTEYCGNDFGLSSTCVHPDLEISLGVSAFRLGLTNSLDVSIKNVSGNPTEGAFTIQLTFPSFLSLQDAGWSESTNIHNQRVYSQTFAGFDALEDSVLSLTDSVGLDAVLDELVVIEGEIIYGGSECETVNNVYEYRDVVVGSIDPNDKLVAVWQRPNQELAFEGDYLYYKIRFQNIGNYAARIVLIEDQLSENLDWESLEILPSSHPFDVNLVNGKLSWYNPNIELPDSLSDPEGSQGYVSFRIKPKDGLSMMTPIDNQASIRFDYNEHIITNVASIYVNGLQDEQVGYLHIRPNPARDYFEVLPMLNGLPTDEVDYVRLYDLQGKMLVLDYNQMGDYFRFFSSNVVAGVYLVEVTLKENRRLRGKVVIE
jgi:hypothetical protein